MGKPSWNWLVLILSASLTVRLAAQDSSWSEIQKHYSLATEARQAGHNDIAIKEFQQILRLDSHNAEAHANIGVIEYTEKNYSQAADEFRAALKLRPSLWNAEAFLGMSEFHLGHPREAKAHLEESFRYLQDAGLRSEAGNDLIALYHQSHDLNRALGVLAVLQGAHPDDPSLLYTAYRTYTELAAQTLSHLASVAPESAQMHRILAQAQESQDDSVGAIAQYRKALELDPTLSGLHFELAQAILAKSTDEPSRQEAEKELQQALVEDPGDANSEYMLGEIAWLRANPQEAREHYAQAVRLQPDFVEARVALGKALTALGRADEALQQLSEAIRLDPQNEVAHYRLAQAYRKLGRTEDAASEMATFKTLQDSHQPVRALFQQVQERPVPPQTVAPDEPQ
ncbi:MAG TPA: tetratricopeptide repeat protein [Terriglobia bacterium]|nr:tetratricopeptide repeat protein [Terriglobia bacterium]